jgi:hypothetical protein
MSFDLLVGPLRRALATPLRRRQRECVTHPLRLDSEIRDGVRFGRDLARNPLNYVNAWVDRRTLFVGVI